MVKTQVKNIVRTNSMHVHGGGRKQQRKALGRKASEHHCEREDVKKYNKKTSCEFYIEKCPENIPYSEGKLSLNP